MSRTKGSGWGAGPMLWQKCPKCGKKRALFDYNLSRFRCTACDEYFRDETGLLIRSAYPTTSNHSPTNQDAVNAIKKEINDHDFTPY